jgi:hypothetical protein
MDVRLLILWHPIHIYQACVLATDTARGWVKTYYTKQECVIELQCLDLLTPSIADKILVDDFEVRDRILIIKAETDPVMLSEAGFDETSPPVIN